MLTESLAIFIVLLVAVFMMVRAGRKPVAVLALPFLGVPLFYLLGYAAEKLFRLRPNTAYGVSLWMTVLGGIAGVVAAVLLVRNVPSKRVVTGYTILCAAFQIALVAAYLLKLV